MAELKETARQYYIPDNYIEEGRVFQGRIRLRNLIEGIVMGMISASVGIVAVLVWPQMKLEIKVSLIAILAIPPLIFGVRGFNGDTVSATLKYAVAWMKNRDTMLYNTATKRLRLDPLMTLMNQTTARDQLLESIEEKRQENIRKKAELSMSEGKDFVFAEDEHVDAYTKRHRKSAAETKGKKQREKEFLISAEKTERRTDTGYDPNLELEFEDDGDFLSMDLSNVK